MEANEGDKNMVTINSILEQLYHVANSYNPEDIQSDKVDFSAIVEDMKIVILDKEQAPKSS